MEKPQEISSKSQGPIENDNLSPRPTNEKVSDDNEKDKFSMKPPNAVKKKAGIARLDQLRAISLDSGIANSGSATGNPRNKTALAPGCSLMDWIRLGSSGVDLTGVGGKILMVTPKELAEHNKEDDAWIAIRGVVFNVTKYLKFHPGGISELMRGVGKDATKLFDDVHAWVNYQSLLQKCVVGKLSSANPSESLLGSGTEAATKNEQNWGKFSTDSSQTIKLDWRQTTVNLTFLFIIRKDKEMIDECQIRKIKKSEFSVRLKLVRNRQIEFFRLKVIEEFDWPPICNRNVDSSEIKLTFKKQNKRIWETYGSCDVSIGKNILDKRQYNEFEVVENTKICKLVYSLVLQAQNYIQMVPPGKHVELKGEVEGTEVSRMYTPIPYFEFEDKPILGPNNCIRLMIKHYENGALSPKLTNAKVGQKFTLSTTLGKFVSQCFDSYGTMHLLAAGTGLTVMLSVIHRNLQKKKAPFQFINLCNFNKNEDNIFWEQELQSLVESDKIKSTHVLSEAHDSWQGKRGIISKKMLEELVGKATEEACVFICGPPTFIKVAKDYLLDLEWQTKQMYEFDD